MKRHFLSSSVIANRDEDSCKDWVSEGETKGRKAVIWTLLKCKRPHKEGTVSHSWVSIPCHSVRQYPTPPNLASEASDKATPSSFSPPRYIFPSLSPFLSPPFSSIHTDTQYIYTHMRDHSKKMANMTIPLLGNVFIVDGRHRETERANRHC